MDLNNKKILITGVINHRSLSYHVLKKISQYNATIWITCQTERIKSKIEKQLNKEKIKYHKVSVLDITKDNDLNKLYQEIKKEWINLDGILHSIAFAPIESFQKKFIDLDPEEIDKANNISSTSFHKLSKKFRDILNEYSSIITLSLDVSLVIPNYNAMVIAKNNLETIAKYLADDLGEESNTRVNVIQSNPVKTIASSLIPKHKDFEQQMIKNSMIKDLVNGEDIANLALFLFSDLSKKITGEVIAVDSGLKKKKIFQL